MLSAKVTEDIFRKQLERLVSSVVNHLQQLQQGTRRLSTVCLIAALCLAKSLSRLRHLHNISVTCDIVSPNRSVCMVQSAVNAVSRQSVSESMPPSLSHRLAQLLTAVTLKAAAALPVLVKTAHAFKPPALTDILSDEHSALAVSSTHAHLCLPNFQASGRCVGVHGRQQSHGASRKTLRELLQFLCLSPVHCIHLRDWLAVAAQG